MDSGEEVKIVLERAAGLKRCLDAMSDDAPDYTPHLLRLFAAALRYPDLVAAAMEAKAAELDAPRV